MTWMRKLIASPRQVPLYWVWFIAIAKSSLLPAVYILTDRMQW